MRVYGNVIDTQGQSSPWIFSERFIPLKRDSSPRAFTALSNSQRGLWTVTLRQFPWGSFSEAILKNSSNFKKGNPWILHHDTTPAHTVIVIQQLLKKHIILMIPQENLNRHSKEKVFQQQMKRRRNRRTSTRGKHWRLNNQDFLLFNFTSQLWKSRQLMLGRCAIRTILMRQTILRAHYKQISIRMKWLEMEKVKQSKYFSFDTNKTVIRSIH